MPITPKPASDERIIEAVSILKQGGLVAFPTETVYGLGADAANPEAVNKIFQAKQRPADHPLIVHIADAKLLQQWAKDIPPAAYALAEAFWPGPLAMVLPKQQQVPLAVTGGQQTVALRVPGNPVALKLLQAFGGGIAAPSANRFNQISPTLAEHVVSELGDAVDMILDGGPCEVGLESTIIDLSKAQPALLRPGHITPEQIEAVIQTTLLRPQATDTRAPGMLELHYAPRTPAALCDSQNLIKQIQQLRQQDKKIAVLARVTAIAAQLGVTVLTLPREAEAYGHEMYAALRQLDALGLDAILIEQLPATEEWLAVNDRLSKATAGTAGILV
jgi:L-threonylcarbamoyladenylate synthase